MGIKRVKVEGGDWSTESATLLYDTPFQYRLSIVNNDTNLDGDEYTWSVNEKDPNGVNYVYSVIENKVPVGYEVSYDNNNPLNVINTFVPSNTEIPVKTIWNGKALNSLRVGLFKMVDGVKTPVLDENGNQLTVELDSQNKWGGTSTCSSSTIRKWICRR